jgi:hypothetical protein
MLVAGDAPAEAVRPILEEAIAVAQAQSARLPELRAATGLARALAVCGNPAEAIGILGPLCENLSEGADLGDVIEAKQVLDSLHRRMKHPVPQPGEETVG